MRQPGAMAQFYGTTDTRRRAAFELRAHGVREVRNPLRAGIHSRGYLPHIKREGASYFVTFRLADSLPSHVWVSFERRRAEALTEAEQCDLAARQEIERKFRGEFERSLDMSRGGCYLRQPKIASMVAEALMFFHGKQYRLEEWVIMPNHVHVVLWPMPNFTLSAILQSRKRVTAREANRMLNRTGEPFWQPESYDHWIRGDEERMRIRGYIRNNPVTARLCSKPEEWPWSSANPSWVVAG